MTTKTERDMETIFPQGYVDVAAAGRSIRDASIAMERAAIMIQSTSEKHMRWSEDIFQRQQALMQGMAATPETPREEQLRLRPQPVMFTTQDGGLWLSWENRAYYNTFHAIQFSDGSILDVANGWRN